MFTRCYSREGKGIVECHYDNFLTKAAKEDRDQAYADGKTPVLARELEKFKKIAAILKGKLSAAGMVFDCETELVALWTETATDGTRVPCRAMLDHWSLKRAMVDDLKTAASAEPEKINRSGADKGYDIQAAAYNRAAHAIHPELVGRVQSRARLLRDRRPIRGDGQVDRGRGGNFYELGEMRWQRGIDTFAWCMNTGIWPEYVTRRIRADVPQWVMQRELDIQARTGVGLRGRDARRDVGPSAAPEERAATMAPQEADEGTTETILADDFPRGASNG